MQNPNLSCPKRVALLALAILTVGASQADAQGDKRSAGSGIFGWVQTLDPASGDLRAIPGAQIELRQGDKTIGQATADERGYYSIVGLSAGAAYQFNVTAPGYRDENFGRGFSLALVEGQAVLDFVMEPGDAGSQVQPELPKNPLGQLNGQVYEKTSSGELIGVNGAEVYLRKVGTIKMLPLIVSPPTEGQNSSGYSATLEAGQWQIIVQASGFDPPPPSIVEVPADQMADPKDLVLTRSGPESSGDGGLVRSVTVYTGGGGVTRYVPQPSGGGGVTRFKPTQQGLRGAVAFAGASSGIASGIRATVRRVGDRADVSPTPLQLDAQGNYTVDRPRGSYLIEAESDGYLPQQSPVSEVLAGSYTVVNLRLERRPAELLVKVYHAESKQPLGAATLRLHRSGESPSAAAASKTDASGQSVFKPVVPADDYEVLATLTGYKAGGEKVQVRAGESKELVLYLTPEPRPAELLVKVYHAESKQPLGAATLRLHRLGESLNAAAASKTDASGQSVFKSIVPAGDYEVLATLTGYKAGGEKVQVRAGESKELVLYLTPVPAELLVKVYHAESKQPLGAAILRLHRLGESPSAAVASKTDASGQWVFKSVVPADDYEVLATLTGYKAGGEKVQVRVGESKELVLYLTPVPAELLVKVYHAESKQPLGAATLRLRRPGESLSAAAASKTDASGQSVFKSVVPADDYEVLATLTGYKAGGGKVQIRVGESKELALYLTPDIKPATLTVNVFDSEQRVLGAATVHVAPDGETPLDQVTNNMGISKLTLVEPGRVLVTVKKTGYIDQQRTVAVNAGENTLTFLLKTLESTLTLYVTDAKTKAPLAGVGLKIDPAISNATGLKTDDKGYFYGKLPKAGRYVVELRMPGYEPAVAEVVAAAGDKAQQIQLTAVPTPVVARRTINVLVREGGRTGTVPIAGAAVRIKNAKQEVVREGVTNELGRFPARNLDLGVYTIEAAKEAYTQRIITQSDIRVGDDQPEVPLYRALAVVPKPVPPPVVVPKPVPPPVVETTVSVPDVYLRDQQTAQTMIQSAGLIFQLVATDPRALSGSASSQQPPAGTRVKPGTRVMVVFKAPAEPVTVADTFGAIAFSVKTGMWGYSNGCDTQEQAELHARQGCKADDAQSVVWVKNGYCALIFDENYAYGVGLSTNRGASAAAAKLMALEDLGKVTDAAVRRLGVATSSKANSPVEQFTSASPNRGAQADPPRRGAVPPVVQPNNADRFTVVEGGRGSFVRQMQNGQPYWVVTDETGKQVTFAETGRDNDYIYLMDADQTVTMSLPTVGGTVYKKGSEENTFSPTPIKIKPDSGRLTR